MSDNGDGRAGVVATSACMQADRDSGMSVRQICEKYRVNHRTVYLKTDPPDEKGPSVPGGQAIQQNGTNTPLQDAKNASEKRHDAGKPGLPGQKPGSPCSRDNSGAVREMPELSLRVCAYLRCKRRELGHTFQPKRVAQIYCSPQCRKAAWFNRHYIPRTEA